MKNLFILLSVLIFSACQQSNNQGAAAKTENAEDGMKAMPEVLQTFEEVNVVKMHLFGTITAMPDPNNYPYTGKAIPSDALGSLADDLHPTSGGKVYACYHTENSDHYILRKTSEDGSSELILAQWDKGMDKLVKVLDLAYIHCEEGSCDQQDAWLTDLDDSRTLELIIRKQTRDAKGNVSNESFKVLTDNGKGHFEKTTENLASLAVKENYVMQ